MLTSSACWLLWRCVVKWSKVGKSKVHVPQENVSPPMTSPLVTSADPESVGEKTTKLSGLTCWWCQLLIQKRNKQDSLTKDTFQ